MAAVGEARLITGMIFGWETPAGEGVGFVRPAAPTPGPARLLSDAGDGHALVVAPTGAGKSRGIAIPNLLPWDGPAIALDIKGELAATTARYRRDVVGQRVVLLDPRRLVTHEPDALDPLEPLTRDDATYSLATLLDTRKMPPFAYREIASFLSVTDVTRSGVLATAINAVRLVGSRRISHAVGGSTFDLGAVVRGEPLSIYLIVPPANLRSHAALIRLWLSALMSLVTARRRLPEKPTLWVLDEFAQLGPMPQLLSAVTLSRSYDMRCLLLVQSLGQLRSAYPADHGVIVENCGSLVTFGHASRAMSAQLAELLGDVSAETLFRLPRDGAALQAGG